MKNILAAAVGVLGLGAAVAAALVQFGAPDFAADTPHGPGVHRLIEWARERSIERRAADIAAPPDLLDAGRIRRGAGNYDAMCATCHLTPGGEDSEMRKGLYPMPPDLSKPARDANAGAPDSRRFWIIKHGIKGSGMPAWSKGGMEDEAIWDLSAFLKAMPSLSAEQYRQQVASSAGHSHGGMDGHAAQEQAGQDIGHHPHPHGDHPHQH